MDFQDVIVSPLEPIDKYINDWLNDDSQNFLVVMGEYGTGKTSLCKHIAKELAISYMDKQIKIIQNKDKRIVFLLNLRSFKAEEIEKFINAELTEFGIKDFDKTDLYSRIENNELIFIFDGFDEMTQRIDTEEKKANFLQIEKLIRERENSKVILTSREEYFTFNEELNEVFKNKENENYKIIHLNLFDDEQIKAYLETHTDNAQFYLDKIKEIYDLSDLAQRPVLLDFIVKYLPKLIEEKGEDITINASDLYRTGIKTELEKKSREVSFLNKKLPTQRRLSLLQKLSVWMYENDTLTINTRIIKEALNLEKFFKVKEEYELIKYLNMFLNFTFLTKESDYTFRISHKSFRDYLVATELVKEINNDKINIFGKHQTSIEINHFISEMKPDRTKLEKYVKETTESTETMRWLKSNAINLILKIDNYRYDRSLDFSFKHIIAPKSNLTDVSILKEIDHFIELGFDESTIENVEPFRNMNKLKGLYLNNNRISDIDPLNNLNKLNSLSLYKNLITNINPISELNKLTSLNLHSNQIKDINPLSSLTQLKELNLASNGISDISCLKYLTSLEKLYLHNNQICNIDVLKNLKNLKQLWLNTNKIVDLDPIQELKKIITLSVGENQIVNISPLRLLNQLEILVLADNNISNIDPLMDMVNLKSLFIEKNKISDLNPLKKLTNLTNLEIDNNQISVLKPLSNLKGLKDLSLFGNQITSIEYLADLPSLTSLNIGDNPIAQYDPIGKLKTLEYLIISESSFINVKPLAELHKLTYLTIVNSKIKDLSPLIECNSLTNLWLLNNEIDEVRILKNLTNLSDLHLSGNPLNKSQIDELRKALPKTNIIF